MSLRQIKSILIIGMLWVMGVQAFFTIFLPHATNMSFICSFIGQCIILFGLAMIDRKAKSMLSRYYGFILCIFIMSYIMQYMGMHNIFVLLGLMCLFLFALYRYLQIFARISKQVLFLYSFYALAFCILVGCAILLSSEAARMPHILPFILSAMIAPALLLYCIALFSFQHIDCMPTGTIANKPKRATFTKKKFF